jgi:hypothetical protein
MSDYDYSHDRRIVDRLRSLGDYANGIIPASLSVTPSRAEVLEVIRDLQLLAGKVDAVVEAYAAAVEAHTGVMINSRYTHNQLERALDDNLFYCIEQAADEAHERLTEVPA